MMGVRQKPNYTGPDPVVAQRLDAARGVRETSKPRWSKRQTLTFIIVFNVVGWTAVWLLFRPQ